MTDQCPVCRTGSPLETLPLVVQRFCLITESAALRILREVLRYYSSNRKEDATFSDDLGHAFIFAARYGFTSVVQFLLTDDYRFMLCKKYMTQALKWSQERQHTDVSKLILQHA